MGKVATADGGQINIGFRQTIPGSTGTTAVPADSNFLMDVHRSRCRCRRLSSIAVGAVIYDKNKFNDYLLSYFAFT